VRARVCVKSKPVKCMICFKGSGIIEWNYFRSIEAYNLSKCLCVGEGASQAAHTVLCQGFVIDSELLECSHCVSRCHHECSIDLCMMVAYIGPCS
jgi:hypothetical protein